MGNERKPSYWRSSRKPPKTSATKEGLLPRTLNIRKSTARRGSTSASAGRQVRFQDEPTVISNETESDHDDEESFRTSVAIAMAGAQIYENGTALHSAIQSHLPRSSHAQPVRTASQHLASFTWTTPPTSPTFSVSPLGSPISPRFDVTRIRYIERALEGVSLDDLLDFDARFHELMWNLTGIREWWDANRLEWVKRRDDSNSDEETLSSVLIQLDAADRADEEAQYSRLKAQYVQQRRRLDKKRAWFLENRYLMKLVREQFKIVQGKTQQLDRGLSGRFLGTIWRAPEGFSFGASPPTGRDVEETLWWSTKGFKWWLEIAAEQLEHGIQIYESNLSERTSKRERAVENVFDWHDHLKQLIEYGPAQGQRDGQNFQDLRSRMQWDSHSDLDEVSWDDQLAAMVKNKEQKVFEKDKDISRTRAMISLLRYSCYEHEFVIKNANALLKRDTAILKLTRRVLAASQGENKSLLLSSPEFVRGLYAVCCYQGLQSQIQMKIQDIFEDDTLQTSDKITIMNLYEVPKFLASDSDKLLIKTLDQAKPFMDDLYEAQYNISSQYQESQRILELAKGVLEERKALEAASQSANSGPNEGAFSAPVPKHQLAVWGQVKTLDQAIAILKNLDSLSQVDDQDPGYVLRRFFVSPDVAPHFLRISKITNDEFLALVDSLIVRPFLDYELEAYLMYCTYVGDLFTQSGNTVSAYGKGWELVDEMAIDSTPRKMKLAKPPGVSELVSWLVQNKQRLLLDGPNRDISEPTLLDIIRNGYPTGNNFTLAKLQEILGYLHQTGELYRYTDEKKPNREVILRRINNGWGKIDINQEYDAIFETAEPYFAQLRSILNRKDVQSALKTASEIDPIEYEDQLYDAIYPYLKVNGILGYGKVIITRHRFHLFLRWCDQNRDRLELRRDGRIIRIN